MFPKPAFGANTSGFGTFSSNAAGTSPFGFKQTTGTSAFGAPPAFGATTTQPTAGAGLFGAPAPSTLFGNTTATPAPAFGATSAGFGGFGASTSAAGGLFNTPTTGGGLFGGTQNTSAFGAKPAGFGFGATPTPGQAGGLFGASTAPSSTGLFGQQSASNLGGSSGLFSSNTTFGQTQPQQAGTGHVKYNPVVGTDVVVKSGTSQNINIKHHCITCMKEYESKSLEELRLEDYTASRKGPQAGGGMFGGFQQPTENKPLFGGTGTFGAPATTTATSVFGGGGITGGTAFGGNNSFSFGGNTQNTANTSGGLFGATKPAFGATTTPGAGLFGATTTQAAPTFGSTTTPAFGFGSNTQNQTGGLFGAKPATSTFGTGNTTTGFGGFGNTGGTTLFGANKPQSAAPAFGTGAPAFGSLSGGFGTTTSTAGGGLFGANTTLGKPATAQPAFGGFNTGGTALGTGLNTGLGGNTFGNTSTAPAFGALGNNNMFGGQQQQTNFSGGMGTGLGGTLFNSSSLGGSGLGLGFGANTASISNNTLCGASAAGNVHEQILNLVARPYGDSPLFKDLPPDSSTTAEDALKPTNPAAMKAVLDSGGAYRVTSPAARLKLQLRPAATQHKKSLFDGLEESDASLEDKLTLKPSRKRLVLRPKSLGDEVNGSAEQLENRSLDEQHHLTDGQIDKENDARVLSNGGDARAGKHASTDEQDSGAGKMRWLNNSQQQWSAEKFKPTNVDSTSRLQANVDSISRLQANADAEGKAADLSDISERYYRLLGHHPTADKEKPIDGESTPRLYPNLDKEIHRHIPMAERRASWLTTKPLRKPAAPHANPEAVESSVRDLGVRQDRSQDKEHLDSLSASEEEHAAPREMPPHPTGVKLTRPGYYTIPSLDEMIKYMRPDGSCAVPHLTIGRKNYGSVYYECEIDVAGLDLDALVFFMNKEVTVYPDDSDKPPVGEGLNRRAIVTLDRVWPRDKTEKRPITDPDRLVAMDYEGKLRRVCDKHDTKFIEYRPETGSWVFRVEHFSKYSLTDSDEEDEITPEVMKRQLVNQQVQQTAPLAPPKPPVVPPPGLGGLGGLGAMSPKGPIGPMGGLSSVPLGPVAGPSPFGDENLYAMHQTSLNLFNGAGKAFEMDTTEDNTESHSLYQDSHRAYGVKSPTSELARLEHRQSHNVQLMKASLYADTCSEIEDNMSVSTGDQQVPRGAPLLAPIAMETVTSLQYDDVGEMREPVHYPILATEEIQMKPLIVRPHTIVLKYHRKVPPFKLTIAGRLDAACIADMSVCRARHTRVGFGPSNNMVYATSYDSINDLPKKAELCELGRYTRGRFADDWSEPVVARLAVGQVDNGNPMQEIIARQLETLLEYSTLSECGNEQCPRAAAVSEPRERRKALKQLTSHFKGRSGGKQYGVSTNYCHEVFKLCEALWGADLENDGVPGMDEQSIVNRHRKFLEWMTSHVAEVTDRELAKPRAGEPEDEQYGHSARIWTLLLGGRVLEACKVAKENGDLNLALLIAQAAGDPTFKSLIARQLSLWRECGADSLISSHKLCILKLIAGLSAPSDKLDALDWSRALHAAARYLTPQVPTLEQIIRKYESFFVQDESFFAQDANTDAELEVDLSEIDSHAGMGMTFPLPPYVDDYDVTINSNGKQRRVLDLRYEIIRARAMNARPKLHPAAYTPDSMDYSLCFLLGAWFGNPTPESITGVASQLEAADAWHLAVQVLMYHPDDNIRGHLIRGVLSRHAPSKPDSAETQGRLQLVRKLRIPHKWLLLAQAHRAKYEHLPAIEVAHLVGAEQWNAAHRVLLEELMPDAVLSDNLKSIAPLLEKLNEAAQRHEVSGWESGGQALHLYINVCDEIRGLVARAENADEAERAAVSSRVEGLRSRVAAACRAMGRLQPATPAHTAAHAEMGARLVQLALAAGEPAAQLAMLLKALKLPPECTTQAHQKITTELAEQASELCIESPSSSPHSSHHRATVHS